VQALASTITKPDTASLFIILVFLGCWGVGDLAGFT
jgi:hypothetical protein